jgi:methionyl aminopeptidase
MIGRNDPCWCGSKKKWKYCHYPKQSSSDDQKSLAKKYQSQYGIILKNKEEIQGIRRVCKLAASILDTICKMAHAGITTNALNEYAERLHKEAGARAAPLGYGDPPFPKSICTSLNDVICHGIPNDIPLMDGDIVSIDVSCELDGYYGDCCSTVMIGAVSLEKRLVTEVSQQCLMRAIEILKPGIMLCEIGNIIEEYATKMGCSTVTQFVGHGIGKAFREPPQVPHHRNNLQIPLAQGMTFTIEPMINAGTPEAVIDSQDGWTARTRDGHASAQWEHMLLITEDGHEVLTLLEK